jgi:ribosomal protein S18 acetylase RimI-like enzyme
MIEGQEPTEGLTIRPCRAEECEAVLALWRRAGAIPSPTDTLEELLRLVRSEHGDGFLVAVRDGGVVGSVIGGWDGWRGGIYRLAVDPQARRHGIAKALVRAAESVLRRKGARRLSVLVERGEAHAVAFWDALAEAGYRRDPRMMRYVKALSGNGS